MARNRSRAMLPLLVLLIIAAGMLVLSSYYLYRAFLSHREGATDASIYYSVIGVTGIVITFYMAFILRKRQFVKKVTPSVVTTTECAKCGFKSLRKYTKGDYVFKTVANCEKCNEPMVITAVYAEPEKK